MPFSRVNGKIQIDMSVEQFNALMLAVGVRRFLTNFTTTTETEGPKRGRNVCRMLVSEDEFLSLLRYIGLATAASLKAGKSARKWMILLNVTNEGNPNYTRYEV